MSRLLSLIGLAVVASLGLAACHNNNGPGGMPGDEMPPMMYRAPALATRSPAAPTVCNSQSSGAAECSPVGSR
jgi:hypothetical protein